MLGAIVVSYLFNFAASHIWSVMNVLQLISHLLLLKLDLPSCSDDVFEILLKVTSFEVFPEELT